MTSNPSFENFSSLPSVEKAHSFEGEMKDRCPFKRYI